LTSSRSIVSIASSPLNRASRTRVPPIRKVPFIATVCPKVWNSGRHPITTSSGRASLASNTFTVAFMTRLRWVSRAPFGSPVVPLV
jgi:hypothetical protein